jgi:hypothetical protein
LRRTRTPSRGLGTCASDLSGDSKSRKTAARARAIHLVRARAMTKSQTTQRDMLPRMTAFVAKHESSANQASAPRKVRRAPGGTTLALTDPLDLGSKRRSANIRGREKGRRPRRPIFFTSSRKRYLGHCRLRCDPSEDPPYDGRFVSTSKKKTSGRAQQQRTRRAASDPGGRSGAFPASRRRNHRLFREVSAPWSH